MSSSSFPPYELVDPAIIAGAADKTRKLERLYHLTQEHAWDGRAVLGGLIDKHGSPGAGMPEATRQALSRVLTMLMWGELAAWNISADLALEIMDTDAKMAATAQVFDEARHFYVMRDYVMALGPVPPIGGLPRRLLKKVLDAPTLATKLVGMQLLFETNAVVLFRRIAESSVCPILAELLPYFERDESRHVGLGVMYIPRLVAKMGKAEARRTARFQFECIMLLMAGGFVVREDFATLGLDQRQLSERVTRMQDDVIRQMREHHGKGVMRAVLTPRTKLGATIIDLIHPEGGIDTAPPWHQSLHRRFTTTFKALDRALS